MTLGEPVRTLVRCNGATVPVELATQEWGRRERIFTWGPSTNLTLNLRELAGTVITEVSPRAADLIRIASYAYRADQLVGRGGEEDASGDNWTRHFGLCIPVANPAFWNDKTVRDRLSAALQFLTDDIWEFAFSQAEGDEWQLPLDIASADLGGRPSLVVLFSGGADSLCALLEATAYGERPIAVGHWSANTLHHRQTELLSHIRVRNQSWGFPHVGLTLHASGMEAREHTRRTRGFLFASLGAAVAADTGLERVIYADNGPISLNLPVNGQVLGAMASRSTHPRFLARFNSLIAEVFDCTVVVTNPLQDRTRAEALEILKQTRSEDLLAETISCSEWRAQPAGKRHCGGCSQCIDRRFATIAAGLEAYDPAARYRYDVFLDDLVEWRHRTMAESYVRFAQHVTSLSPAEILAEYGQLFDAVLEGDPHPDATVAGLVELIQRHVASTLDVISTMSKRYLSDLLELRLPADCLLRIALAGTPLVGSALPVTTNDEPGRRDGAGPNGEGSQLLMMTGASISCDGEICEIVYGGVRKRIKQLDGLTRLAVLLMDPNREFSPEELEGTAHGMANADMDAVNATFEGLSVHEQERAEPILGDGSADFINSYIHGLEEEMQRARAAGNAERAADLSSQIKQIRREVRKAKGLPNKPRTFSTNAARRDRALDRSIRRAIDAIAERHGLLGEHLSTSYLHRAARFSYKPGSELDWSIELPPH